jgi:hypothetical protein
MARDAGSSGGEHQEEAVSDRPVEVRARSSHEARPAKVLVLATERCAGESLLEEIRYRASGPHAVAWTLFLRRPPADRLDF